MITGKQWKIFKDCRGNYESLFRAGNKKEKALMEDFDWLLINDLVRDMHMMFNGLLSDEYSKQVLERMNKLECEPGVMDDIIKYSKDLLSYRLK